MKSNAKIVVKGSKVHEERINPYIFGNFVEDIRDHMDAMLAYAFTNMDFEEEDNNNDGVSGDWYPLTNGKNTKYALEPAAPHHSGHSQRIRVFYDDEACSGIGKKIIVKANTKYKLNLYLRASLEIKKLSLEILDLATQEVIGSAIINIESHMWREYKAEVFISKNCSNTELRLMIPTDLPEWKDSVATGILWIDHVSMLPEDSVGNVKKEVFDMTKDLDCAMMRISGNYMSAYHWEYGIGPMYNRPNMVNEVWGGWASKYFGNDEFIQFCKDLGVDPLISVNDGSGTPEEAAAWVEYCNGSKDTKMGALRAANGFEEPYNVKYWEIGNEVWGPWQVGHCTPEEYANRYIKFTIAMKAVDPNIKLLCCGDSNPLWNEKVVEIAGEYMDYLTMHPYHSFGRIGISGNASVEDKYYGTVCYPEVTRVHISKVSELISRNPRHSHIKLAFTEYNTMYFNNTIRKGLPNEHTLEAAVANAGNFNEFIRNCDMVQIGNFSDLVNGWLGGCIRVGDCMADQFRGKITGWSEKNLVTYGTPTYYALKLYGNSNIDYVLSSTVECDTFTVPCNISDISSKKLPVIDTVACINENEDLLTLFVTNRALEKVNIVISLDDFAADGEVIVNEITGEDKDSLNTVFKPEEIKCIQNKCNAVDNKVSFELKPHSIYSFEVKGQKIKA